MCEIVIGSLYKVLRGVIKKPMIFWEFFHGGGGLFQFNCKSYFWYAKIILRRQNMFYDSEEVISDQFNHLILI